MALPLAACLALVLAFPAAAQSGRSAKELKADLIRDFYKGTDVSALDFTGQAEPLKQLFEQVKYVQAGREPGDEKETHVTFIRSVARRLPSGVDHAVELYGDRVRSKRAVAATPGEIDARAALALDVSKNRGISTAKKERINRDLQATSLYLSMGLNGDAEFVGGANTQVAVFTPAAVVTNQVVTGSDFANGEKNNTTVYLPQVQRPTFITNPTPVPGGSGNPSYYERIAGLYGQATAYVSAKIDAASTWVTGTARTVKNKFFKGIELIAGYGYQMIYPSRKRNYGREELIDGIRKISAYMYSQNIASTELLIGDVSAEKGGSIGHLSHRVGVDADIGYYMIDVKTGNPYQATQFVTFNENLRGYANGRSVRLDTKRNWELIKAILANPDPKFKPSRIFMAKHIEKGILAEAKTEEAPLRKRAVDLLQYWPHHENHLHLRIEQ